MAQGVAIATIVGPVSAQQAPGATPDPAGKPHRSTTTLPHNTSGGSVGVWQAKEFRIEWRADGTFRAKMRD